MSLDTLTDDAREDITQHDILLAVFDEIAGKLSDIAARLEALER